MEKGTSKTITANHCVVGCNNTVLAASAMATTSDELQHAFDRAGMKCVSEVIPIPTPLCKHHYHVVYGELQKKQK